MTNLDTLQREVAVSGCIDLSKKGVHFVRDHRLVEGVGSFSDAEEGLGKAAGHGCDGVCIPADSDGVVQGVLERIRFQRAKDRSRDRCGGSIGEISPAADERDRVVHAGSQVATGDCPDGVDGSALDCSKGGMGKSRRRTQSVRMVVGDAGNA